MFHLPKVKLDIPSYTVDPLVKESIMNSRTSQELLRLMDACETLNDWMLIGRGEKSNIMLKSFSVTTYVAKLGFLDVQCYHNEILLAEETVVCSSFWLPM